MNLLALLAILTGILLLAISSFILVTLARLKGATANILALAVAAYGTIVLLAQILSELHGLHRWGFLGGQLLLVGLLLPWGLKPALAQLKASLAVLLTYAAGWRKSAQTYPTLVVLSLALGLAMLIGAYLIAAVPANEWDSLWYHLPRVAHWLQNNTLRHFLAPNVMITTWPINADVCLLWLTALWGTDQLAGFNQWLVTIFTMVSIYGLARQVNFSKPASTFAALIWGTFTIVIAQSTSTKNDIAVAFFVAAAFYFLLTGLQDQDHKYSVNLVFFGLSLGLAVGTKITALLAILSFVLAAAVLVAYKPGHFLPRLVYAGLCALVGFMLLGSYNYVLNWLSYGSIFGPPVNVEDQSNLQILSMTIFKANLGRVLYQFSGLVGLPGWMIDIIQPGRAFIGERLFALFQINPNPPDSGWQGSRFSFNSDANEIMPQARAWYGPLGFLLFLPSLFFYLVIYPWLKKDLWKWLIAWVSFLYILLYITLIRWEPYNGRLYMIGVALGTPLTAGFFAWTEKYKPLRWLLVVIAITVLGFSSTHNYHRPLIGSGTWSIWNLDYYDLRTHQRDDVAVFRYLDTILPADSRVGVAVTSSSGWWDYLFFGPGLTRQVIFVGPFPDRVDQTVFQENKLDYLLLASEEPKPVNSAAPAWPVGNIFGIEWYLVKRSEVEAFTALPPSSDDYAKAFGEDYSAYLQVKSFAEQETPSFRILTTDPKMLYYDRDQRFTFAIPKDITDLQGFNYLVMTPYLVERDYDRLGFTPQAREAINNFLSEEKYVQRVYEVNGYVVYRILFSS